MEVNLVVRVLPLVPNVVLPKPAPAKTRARVPPGYGVQEQCLPFAAASALGFVIGSPIAFGICPMEEVPPGCHAFRSPLDGPDRLGCYRDERVFYVKDEPRHQFAGNAFTLDTANNPEAKDEPPLRAVEPGISFFDRHDQDDLFKLHLPYIWRTPPEVDTLFLPAINRPIDGLTVLAGLVETDWYAHPVNLVVRKSPQGTSSHVSPGDLIAQTIFLPRNVRRATVEVLSKRGQERSALRHEMAEWYSQHAKKRSAYKLLARARHSPLFARSAPSRRSS